MWLVYLAFVAGTALFAFYEQRQSQQEQEESAAKELIFPHLKPEKIQSIILKDEKADKKPISFFRERKGWKINSPVKDIADRDIIGDWLKTLLAEKVQLIKKEESNWAEYGLDKDIKTIEITTTYGKKLKVNISHYSAFDGRFYIQKGKNLLLGGTGWANLTSKDGDYFRSYKIINELERPSFIEYRSSSFSAHLKWENGSWQWAGKKEQGLDRRSGRFPLSQSQLESYWSSFKNISFEKEKEQGKGQGAALEDSPTSRVGKPIAEFRIGFLKGSAVESPKDSSLLDVLEIKISPKKEGQFYVFVSDRKDVFALNQGKGKELFLTEQKIRDHSYPFQFERDRVAFVDIKGYGADIQFEKKRGKWQSLRTTKEPASKDELEEILDKIPYLSAEEYFKEPKTFKPTAHIVLKGKEGEALLHLDFGAPFVHSHKEDRLKVADLPSKKDGKKPEEDKVTKQVFVKSRQGTELMALPWEDVQALFPFSSKK